MRLLLSGFALAVVLGLLGTAIASQPYPPIGYPNSTTAGGDFGADFACNASANGPEIECSASSATNPTLIPDKASQTAGIGGTSGDVSIITGGAERINVDTAGNITVTTPTQITGANSFLGIGATGNDGIEIWWNTLQTPDATTITVDGASRMIVFMEEGDQATDFAHANPTHPVLFVHTSNVSPNTEYRGYQAAGSQGELSKTLTESAATSIVQIPVAAGSGTGGMLTYTVYAADATNHQARVGRVVFSVVNEAGTETCVLGTVEEIDNTPTGTLTASVTCSTSPTNAIDIQINAVSSLTQTTLRAYYHVTVNGPGTPLPQ